MAQELETVSLGSFPKTAELIVTGMKTQVVATQLLLLLEWTSQFNPIMTMQGFVSPACYPFFHLF